MREKILDMIVSRCLVSLPVSKVCKPHRIINHLQAANQAIRDIEDRDALYRTTTDSRYTGRKTRCGEGTEARMLLHAIKSKQIS